MQKLASILIIATSCLVGSAMAQSDIAPAAACPAQYELMGGTLCIKFNNGDIVLPTASTASVRFTNANCRSGYEIMVDNLCMSSKTGDIVFADLQPNSATQTAKK